MYTKYKVCTVEQRMYTVEIHILIYKEETVVYCICVLIKTVLYKHFVLYIAQNQSIARGQRTKKLIQSPEKNLFKNTCRVFYCGRDQKTVLGL